MLFRRLPNLNTVRFNNRMNSPMIDQPLNIPTGESDVGLQTRLTFLSRDSGDSSRIGIRGMSREGFRMFDLSFLYGPIACFPTVALSWRVLTPEDITPASLGLFLMLRPKLDVLVIGVGARKNLDLVRRNVIETLKKHRIGMELMVTEDAITTYNFLNLEHRYVAGAFYPQEDLKVNRTEQRESLQLHESMDAIPGNPLIENFGDPVKEARGILNRMYGEGREAENMLKKVEEIRELDLKIKKVKFERMIANRIDEQRPKTIERNKQDLKLLEGHRKDLKDE